jgi:hypothetical protein
VFAFDPQQNLFSRTGFSINAVLEDIPRITHYMAKRSEGLSEIAARQSMLKALGNFRELSQGDEALRSVMPFWAWTRFNVPRQIRGIFEGLGGDITKGVKGFRPGGTAMVAHMQVSLDDKFKADVPRELLPEWFQGQMSIPMGFADNGDFEFWVMNRWLPLADLTEIDSPRKMAQFMVNSLSPILSEPIEQAFNFDTFFKRVIENYPGEQEHFLGYPLAKRTAHLVRNARILGEFDRLWAPLLGLVPSSERMQKEIDFYGKEATALRAFTGLKPRRFNLKDTKKKRVRGLKIAVGRLKGEVRRAKKKGDRANEANFRRLLANAKSQLRVARKFRPERNPHFRALELS